MAKKVQYRHFLSGTFQSTIRLSPTLISTRLLARTVWIRLEETQVDLKRSSDRYRCRTERLAFVEFTIVPHVPKES